MHTYPHRYRLISVNTDSHAHISTQRRIHSFMYIDMHIFTYTFTEAYMKMYTGTHTCVYIFTNTYELQSSRTPKGKANGFQQNRSRCTETKGPPEASQEVGDEE